MNILKKLLCLAGIAAAAAAGPAHAQQQMGHGAVFTMSNEADGNELIGFHRLPNGMLAQGGSIPSGGDGTGMGLGNQGGLIDARGGTLLYAVNAGSGTISVFRRTNRGYVLAQVVDAGGDTPISLTQHGSVLYALNADGAAGGTDHINGFRLGPRGGLAPIPNSTRTLSAANTGPAQVGFSPDGRKLVVTEKMTNLIDTFLVSQHGFVGQANPQPSAGMTPFGFGFSSSGFLIVSEAFGGAPDASAVSSYSLSNACALTTISASVPTGETAACWIARTADSRFIYTTNTGSNSVSGYSLDTTTGVLTALTAPDPTAATGMGPIDADTVGNRYLYILAGGSGEINAYRINENGSLTLIQTVTGLPASANGLVAR
jgi:6-phosphogluconolactonase